MMDQEDVQAEISTMLQKRKRKVPISNQEILLMLRAYTEHPSSWNAVIDSIMENIHTLPSNAQSLYREGNRKNLKERISAKISKLVYAEDSNNVDEEIRGEIENVREIKKVKKMLRSKEKKADERKGVPQPSTSKPVADASSIREDIISNLDSTDSESSGNETAKKKRKGGGKKRAKIQIKGK